MGGAAGELNYETTQAWRLAIFFLFFLIISIVAEKVLHWLLHFFKRRMEPGLVLAVEKFKEECMLLGVISFVLVMCQDGILHICVPDNWLGHHDDYSESGDAAEDAHRRLAGGGPVDCGEGWHQFITVTALHQVHIFIFLLALSLIITASTTMMMAMARVKRWLRWESNAEAFDAYFDTPAGLTNDGGPPLAGPKGWFGAKEDTYLHCRRYFIRKHKRKADFNFFDYIVHCMEDEFAKTVTIDALDWLVAILTVLLRDYFFTLGMSVCTLLASLLVGRKLQQICEMLVKDTLAMSAQGGSHAGNSVEDSKRALKGDSLQKSQTFGILQLHESNSDTHHMIESTDDVNSAGPRSNADEQKSNTLWVGNLPDAFVGSDAAVAGQNLAALCAGFGAVLATSVRLKPGKGGKSWSLVTFGDPAAVAAAIQVGLSVPDGGAEVELLLKTADVKGELQRHVKEGQTGFLASAALQQQDQVDISAARHDFEEADVDSGGTLDQDEVAALLKKMGFEVSDQYVAEVFRRFDLDQGGTLEYDEFLQLYRFMRQAQAKAGTGKKLSAVLSIKAMKTAGRVTWCCGPCGPRVHPSRLRLVIRTIMFQNAMVIAMLVFHAWQVGSDSEYFKTDIQGWDVEAAHWGQFVIMILQVMHCSFITMPMYAMVNQLGRHHNIRIFGESASHVLAWANRSKARQESLRRSKSWVRKSTNAIKEVGRKSERAMKKVFSETKTLTRLHSHDNGDVEVASAPKDPSNPASFVEQGGASAGVPSAAKYNVPDAGQADGESLPGSSTWKKGDMIVENYGEYGEP